MSPRGGRDDRSGNCNSVGCADLGRCTACSASPSMIKRGWECYFTSALSLAGNFLKNSISSSDCVHPGRVSQETRRPNMAAP